MTRSESVCRFEGLEGRDLLSTVSASLFMNVSNAPIWGGGPTWDCTAKVLDWTGPDLMAGNVGVTRPHVDLSVHACAKSATVSATVGGNLSVSLPDTVTAGQRHVPITIKFTPTSETMSGQLDGGVTMPLTLSSGYQNLPNQVGTGKLISAVDLLAVWNKYIKAPIISQKLKLNTPAANCTPTMGKAACNTVTTTVVSGVPFDALQVAAYQVPAAGAVNRDVAMNVNADVNITRTDNLLLSEFDGTLAINGVNVPFAIGRSGSTTVYVNIPGSAKSNVSVSVGKFALKNSYYASFGIATANSYVELDSKVAFANAVIPMRHYAQPAVAASLGCTVHSQLNFSTATTASGTMKVV